MPPKGSSSEAVSGAEYNLLHHLSSRKPNLQATPQSKSRSNSTNQRWRRPSQIVKWEDFNCVSLMKCCAGLFCELLNYKIEPMKFPHLEKETIIFADESALEKAYVSQWTYPIINHALSHAQSQAKDLGIRPPFVGLAPGGNAKRTSRNKPDWAGIRTTLPHNSKRTLNIIPGDTKVSYKWRSTQIVPKIIDKNDLTQNWLWPLRQIFTYCLDSNTRYGYIISDEEVVAFRVRVPHERIETKRGHKVVRSKDRGTIEYAPVYSTTQEAGGENILTMNMAIWWLHLLAANNRALQADYDPLIDETLDGLGRSPTPSQEERDRLEEDPSVTGGTSPTTVNGSVTDSFATQPSAYFHSFGPLTGLTGSFASMHSTRSTRSKRKRDGVEHSAESSKRKKAKAKAKSGKVARE